jgi:hypothetical protein
MAAVIPEAAEAVGEGTTAVRSTAAAGAAGSARPRRSQQDHAQRARQHAQRAGRTIGRARVPGNRNYQPVILAEFMVAVLVVALAPIAKGGTDTAKAKGSPSPYDTDTLKQILGIGIIYFILALLSSGQKMGRFAAWFGALVLVAVGIQQTTNGGILAVIRMFEPGTGAGLGTFPAGGDATGAGAGVSGLHINAGQFSPGALAQGVSTAPPDATGDFPTLLPGGQILPAVNIQDAVTSADITPPPGGTGTTTTA